MSQEANSNLPHIVKKLIDKGFKASVEDIKFKTIVTSNRLVVMGDRFDTPLFCDLADVFEGGNEDDVVGFTELLDNLRVSQELRRLGWFAQVEEDDEHLLVKVYDRSGRSLILEYELEGVRYTKSEVKEVVEAIVSDLVDGGHTGECIGLEDTATGDLFIPTPGEVSDPDPARTVAEAAEEDLI